MIDFAFQSLILAFAKKQYGTYWKLLLVLSSVVPKMFQSSVVFNKQQRLYSLVIRVWAWAEKDVILGMNGME